MKVVRTFEVETWNKALTMAEVQCHCGKLFKAPLGVINGLKPPTSCGCGKTEAKESKKVESQHFGTREHFVWSQIKDSACERWQLFSNFLADMGKAPRLSHLAIKDKTQKYSKENCEWKIPGRK